MPTPTSELQSCDYLFLRDLAEPEANALRIVLEEARPGRQVDAHDTAAASRMPELEPLLHGAQSVVHGPGCRVFELSWAHYVAYAVLNESYLRAAPDEVGEGRQLVRYRQSRFLEYVHVGTNAPTLHPRPYQHWRLFCGDHIIDVVAAEEPQVRVMSRDT